MRFYFRYRYGYSNDLEPLQLATPPEHADLFDPHLYDQLSGTLSFAIPEAMDDTLLAPLQVWQREFESAKVGVC